MKILHRYIAKSIFAATSLVILVMAALTFIICFLDEMKDVGSADYGFWQAFIHVLLEFPRSLYQLFPMLMLMGGVIGLGVLAANRELIVIRTAGFSVTKIGAAVITAALGITLVATLFGEGFVPKAHHLAQVRKQSEQNGGQAISTQSGVWIHEGNNFLQINRVIGLQHLEKVTRYQFDSNHHLLASYYINSLDFVDGKWILHDVIKTTFLKNKTLSTFSSKTNWDMVLSPSLLNVGVIEPGEMSLAELSFYSNHLLQNGLQASDLQWEFWKRIFQPVTTIIMILLSIPFVFGFSRTVTMGWRVLFGIIVGFTFYILNAFLGQFSVVFQLSPLIAAILPTFLFAGIGLALALRLRL